MNWKALAASTVLAIFPASANGAEDGAGVAELQDVRAFPSAYLHLPIQMEVLYNGPGEVYNPFYTEFEPTRFLNFSAWGTKTELWKRSEYSAPFRFFYVSRDAKEVFLQLSQLKARTWIRATFQVRSTFHHEPWIELTGIERVGKSVDRPTLTHMVRGWALAEQSQWQRAAVEMASVNVAGMPRPFAAKFKVQHARVAARAGDTTTALSALAQARNFDRDVEGLAAATALIEKQNTAVAHVPARHGSQTDPASSFPHRDENAEVPEVLIPYRDGGDTSATESGVPPTDVVEPTPDVVEWTPQDAVEDDSESAAGSEQESEEAEADPTTDPEGFPIVEFEDDWATPPDADTGELEIVDPTEETDGETPSLDPVIGTWETPAIDTVTEPATEDAWQGDPADAAATEDAQASGDDPTVLEIEWPDALEEFSSPFGETSAVDSESASSTWMVPLDEQTETESTFSVPTWPQEPVETATTDDVDPSGETAALHETVAPAEGLESAAAGEAGTEQSTDGDTVVGDDGLQVLQLPPLGFEMDDAVVADEVASLESSESDDSDQGTSDPDTSDESSDQTEDETSTHDETSTEDETSGESATSSSDGSTDNTENTDGTNEETSAEATGNAPPVDDVPPPPVPVNDEHTTQEVENGKGEDAPPAEDDPSEDH